MKTKEELNVLKKEVEEVSNKIAELTEEEQEQVCGGLIPPYPFLATIGFQGFFDGNSKTVPLNISLNKDSQE